MTMPKKLFSKADLKIKPFDSADYLTGPDMILGYLNEVIATGNPGDLGAAAIIQHALGVAARAHGMTKVAKATGLSRENLYRSLSAENNANFGTILRVIDALGFELVFKSKKARTIRSKAQAKSGKRIAAEVRLKLILDGRGEILS
jgi:probable addiction module antidote protein